jgi:hypothetical protein
MACAVGYAGLYDLAMMYDKGDIRENKSGRSYLKTVIGKGSAGLDANSPAKLADTISVPVLLVHGEGDKRAPFAQAKPMRATLEAAHKPYEWLEQTRRGPWLLQGSEQRGVSQPAAGIPGEEHRQGRVVAPLPDTKRPPFAATLRVATVSRGRFRAVPADPVAHLSCACHGWESARPATHAPRRCH